MKLHGAVLQRLVMLICATRNAWQNASESVIRAHSSPVAEAVAHAAVGASPTWALIAGTDWANIVAFYMGASNHQGD